MNSPTHPKRLRVNHVRVPHKNSAYIILHRMDGRPVKLLYREIMRWEEYQQRHGNKVTLVYWGGASCTTVSESFDVIDAAINGKDYPDE